jgi:hypothetical protein
MNLPPDWLKVLYRPGKALQAQELTQSQLIASRQIGFPFQYLIGQFRVTQGLSVTPHTDRQGGTFVRVSSGRVAVIVNHQWRVVSVPPHELAYTGELYIGLLINEVISNLDPDPALGGPILGVNGNPLVKLSVKLTTRLNQGFPIAEVIGGKVYHYHTYLSGESQYNDFLRELRARLYEELGDFIYQGLTPTLINPQLISISPGIAYIKGQRVQTHSPQLIMAVGPKAYLTLSGNIICPPTNSLSITTGRVKASPDQDILHRVGLPILIRSPIPGLDDISTLPRLEVCQLTPTLKGSPFRLPPAKQIYELYQSLLEKRLAQPDETLTDQFHPLYTARDTQEGITLGRYQVKVNVESYTPPYNVEVYSWQTGLTEYNQCPETRSPYLHFKGQVLTAYNLPNTPLPLTCRGEGKPPVGVQYGAASGNIITPANGHVNLITPYDCLQPWLGPYGVSSSPLLDRGFAQEFEASMAIQVKGFSFYTQGSFTGLVVLSSGGMALSWAPVLDGSGEVYVEFPLPATVTGTFRINLISNSKALVGVYDVNSNAPRTESVTSKRLFLSVDGQWIPIPNKDLTCELLIAKGIPDSQYEVNIPISHQEAFDEALPDLTYQNPLGSLISLKWYRDLVPLVDLTSFPPTNTLTLSVKSTLSPNGSLPFLLGGDVSLSMTRKESTWVGRDEETNKVYNQALLLIEYYLPEGANIKPYLSSDGGRTWFGFDESNITKLIGDKYQAEYRVIDLPLSLLMTDVNGEAYSVPRTRGRVRLDLSTQQPQARPMVYDVKIFYSYS